MKKVSSAVTIFLLIMMMSGSLAFADMGGPSEPEYSVVLSIYGVDYYSNYDDFIDRNPAGILTGGQAFYVWDSSYEGGYYGTTDAKAGSDQFGSFVYIVDTGTESASDMIQPEVGTKLDKTITASTTDDLNLRYGPGTGFKVIKTLNKNTELTYDYTFNTDTTWAYVKAGDLTGWVSADYLQIKASASDAADNETVSEEASSQEQEATGTLQRSETETSKDKRRVVAGIICICIGTAVLIAVIAAYLLKRRNDPGRR